MSEGILGKKKSKVRLKKKSAATTLIPLWCYILEPPSRRCLLLLSPPPDSSFLQPVVCLLLLLQFSSSTPVQTRRVVVVFVAMESQQEKAVLAPAANGSGGGELIGYVDVHVQSARDIQNICIYHKQDVYARLSLPGEGAPAASTQVINGGGRNPVFDQSLRLGVRAGDVDGALRCEVWMLSRVKNYLQDQLLGFALVPLPDVVAAEGGTLAREFPLSTNDIFHSHAGFLQLELSYIGVVPEVVPISPTPKPALADTEEHGAGAGGGAANGKEYEKIEFPDLNLVEENQIMLSEYIGLPCSAVEPQSSESLLTSEEDGDGATAETHVAGVRVVQSFSTDNSTADSAGTFRSDTPVSSVSTTESPAAAAVPATPQSNSSGNAVSSAEQKEKAASDAADAEVQSSASPAVNSPGAMSESAVDKPPVIRVNLEQEVKVDQKEIMDMYMKSMQQFTESLAKMKLPLDLDNGSSDKSAAVSGAGAAASDADSSGADSGAAAAAAKKPVAGGPEKSPKVFYGSRAFF
uniref:C2 domain-containing protein n=1 Tax=Oryza meridionalis TaxID=40149 RepID=A0A0E0EDP5_9ORYZ